jgi:DNA polymerase/3'-5' exonuclease PolX
MLAYSHAAAAVRACAVPLASPERATPSWLEKHVPFVGAFIARVLADLLHTGSCEQLRGFEADAPVRDSKGELRLDSAGGAARARFCKLPAVGPVRARRWFELGLRSYDDALAATQARRLPVSQSIPRRRAAAPPRCRAAAPPPPRRRRRRDPLIARTP